MAVQSSILAWRFPWTEEPGGLQSVWSLGFHFHFPFTAVIYRGYLGIEVASLPCPCG